MPDYELVIIGGGPAGMAAGIYGARMGLSTVILEELVAGGTTAISPLIENYPGFVAIKGTELAARMEEQTRKSGCDFRTTEKVISLDPSTMTVKTASDSYTAKAIVLATGTRHRKLGCKGEHELEGFGVSYCATCDGPLYRDKRVAVVGGGSSAALEALYLQGIAREVHLIHRRDDLRAEDALKRQILDSKIVAVHWNTVVDEIVGDGERGVSKIQIKNAESGEIEEIRVKAVFVAVGEVPNNELAIEAGIRVNEEGYVIVNEKMETGVSGIYAAGDIIGGIRQITTAVGSGTIAAMNAYLYIKGGWYGKKK